jgi:hypothetical protein
MENFFSGGDLALDFFKRWRDVVGMHEFDERPRSHLFDAPAERVGESLVDAFEISVGMSDDEHVDRDLEKPVVDALGELGVLAGPFVLALGKFGFLGLCSHLFFAPAFPRKWPRL